MKVFTAKKQENLDTMLLNHHFLVVWTSFIHFMSKYFPQKRGNLSSLIRVCVFLHFPLQSRHILDISVTWHYGD